MIFVDYDLMYKKCKTCNKDKNFNLRYFKNKDIFFCTTEYIRLLKNNNEKICLSCFSDFQIQNIDFKDYKIYKIE